MTHAREGRQLRIGVSACLLGEEVRYDGAHKLDRFVTDELGRHARFVPVCPEVGVGMGVPRETVNLVRLGRQTHMVASQSGKDWTSAMRSWARARVEALAEDDLDGYVLKARSPSCGMEKVKLYPAKDLQAPPALEGVGLYAAELMARFPLLPVEEETRLHDAGVREGFVERVFAYRRLRAAGGGKTRGDLTRFHADERLTVRAHDADAHERLARLVRRPPAYARGFMAALARPATIRSHAQVLAEAARCVAVSLDADDRRELRAAVEDFGKGRVPRLVPLALLRHHARKHRVAELLGQTYLEPHPEELMLRYHV